MWAFGVSPYGLALSGEQVWSYTPREYAFLKREWKSHRHHADLLYADLQTTLHNAWFRTKEHPQPYKREDFLDSDQKPAPKKNQGWLANKQMLEARMAQVKQTERRMRGLSG